MRIIDRFDRGALSYPENTAFMDVTGRCSYQEASHRTHLIASALHNKNFGKGVHVALLAPTSNVAFICLLAIFRVGAVWLPISPRQPVAVNADLLHRFNGGLLLYHSAYEAQAKKLARRVPSMNPPVCIDGMREGEESLSSWTRDADSHFPPLDYCPDDSLLVFPTGATTETVTRVVVTHADVAMSFANFYARCRGGDTNRYLSLAPLEHSAGVLACLTFSSGGSNFIMPNVDPGAILRAIQQHLITHLFVTAALLKLLLAHPFVRLYDYSSLKLFMIGGADSSAKALAQAEKIFGPVVATVDGEMAEQRDANCQIGRLPFWYKFALRDQSS